MYINKYNMYYICNNMYSNKLVGIVGIIVL